MDLSEGTKYDEDKIPMDLLSPHFLSGISEVLRFGAKKYEPYNWAKGIKYSRVYSALQRHLWAFWAGEELDDETGLPHLWHAGCCLMFLIHYEANQPLYKEFDDSPEIYKASETSTRPRSAPQELSGSRGLSGEDSEPTVVLKSRDGAFVQIESEWPGEGSVSRKQD